jgi:hypothetical protein
VILPPVVRSADEGGDVLRISTTPDDISEGEIRVAVLMCAGGEIPGTDELPTVDEYHITGTPTLGDLCKGGEGFPIFKTVSISDSHSRDPQTNPVIDYLLLDEKVLPTSTKEAQGKLSCPKESPCVAELAIHITEQSVEWFDVGMLDDGKEDRVFIQWYATGGHFFTPGTDDICEVDCGIMGHPCAAFSSGTPTGPFRVDWRPRESGVYSIYAVAKDLRDGASWQTYTIDVNR